MILIHEEKAEYDQWLKVLYIIPLGLLVGAIILASYHDMEAFLALLGEAIVVTLIFYFVMPRKYQIFQDKVNIVLGSPFTISIPLTTIKEAKHSKGSKAYVYSGVRFATSSRYVVEIVRNKGMNYVISPQNGDLFLEQLNQAIKDRGK
jgi:hypothetical protein